MKENNLNLQRLIKYLEKIEKEIVKIENEISRQVQNHKYKDFERDTELENRLLTELREEREKLFGLTQTKD